MHLLLWVHFRSYYLGFQNLGINQGKLLQQTHSEKACDYLALVMGGDALYPPNLASSLLMNLNELQSTFGRFVLDNSSSESTNLASFGSPDHSDYDSRLNELGAGSLKMCDRFLPCLVLLSPHTVYLCFILHAGQLVYPNVYFLKPR